MFYSKKSHSFKFFLIFLSLINFSCSPKELVKDTLFVLLDSKPSTLDPRKATDANGMRISALVFNGLVKIGDKGELLPDLAFHWELKNLTWTFYLNPNLSFSNGRAVKEEDILFSFKEFRQKSSPFYSAFKNIKSVKVNKIKIRELKITPYLDNLKDKNSHLYPLYQNFKLTQSIKGKLQHSLESSSDTKSRSQNQKPQGSSFVVKIFLKQFQAPFLYSDLPVIKILPKKETLEFPEAFQQKPIGTGDFEIVKSDFHGILLKRRFKVQHSRTAQSVLPKYISFQIIRDSLTRTQKMLSKETDIAPSVLPLQKISQFQRQKESFRILSRPGLSTTYLLINFKNKLLQNRELRKALSLSIHREEIIKYKLKGYAIPAKAFINPENYFFNKELANPVFDLQTAKDIIRRLSLKGTRLQLSSSNNQETFSKAKVLASQINQTGLKISLKSNEWGAFYKDVGWGAYELALMKWVGVSDPDIYRVAFHSENQAPQGRNRSFYKNQKLNQLLNQGFKERNQIKRKQIYDQIQLLISQDFVVIPLWHDMEVSVLRANVENYQLRFNGDFLSLPFVRKK